MYIGNLYMSCVLYECGKVVKSSLFAMNFIINYIVYIVFYGFLNTQEGAKKCFPPWQLFIKNMPL